MDVFLLFVQLLKYTPYATLALYDATDFSPASGCMTGEYFHGRPDGRPDAHHGIYKGAAFSLSIYFRCHSKTTRQGL